MIEKALCPIHNIDYIFACPLCTTIERIIDEPKVRG